MAKAKCTLETPVSGYPVFERDQVLTADHLNQVVSYFDYQTKASRARLDGVGIVCGLEIEPEENAIVITHGCAVTTDGDLLLYDRDQRFTHYKKYEDKFANYSFFTSERSTTSIELLELIEEGDERVSSSDPISDLEPLSQYVTILYLESFEFDPDICTGTDCDNQGRSCVNKLRALLIKESDIGKFLDSIPNIGKLYFDLNPVSCSRVKLNENIKTYTALHQPYKSASSKMIALLKSAIPSAYSICESILKDLHTSNPTSGWNSELTKFGQELQKETLGCQYYYDGLKDIVTAFNEFVELIFDANSICCPDVKLFPKHVRLGRAQFIDDPARDEFRHGFYPSPALVEKIDRIRRARFSFVRIGYLIENFSIPRLTSAIRITPSDWESKPLGDRALPYYYNIDAQDPVNQRWSYDAYVRNKYDKILSYNSEKYTSDNSVNNPWDHCYSHLTFYRIEGCLGKNYKTAEQQIRSEIKQKNIPFRLISIQVEDDVTTVHMKPQEDWHVMVEQELLKYKLEIQNQLNEAKIYANVINALATTRNGTGSIRNSSTIDDLKRVTAENVPKLDMSINFVLAELEKPPENIDFGKFLSSYEEAQTAAVEIGRYAPAVTYDSSMTPLDIFVKPTLVLEYLTTVEIINTIQKEAKEKLILAKFLSHHPGLEHFAGVERGGTFVLVYTAKDERVVADFCLPYCCDFEIEQEPAKIVTIPTIVKYKPIEFDDHIFRMNPTNEVFKNITDIKNDYEANFKNLKQEIKLYSHVYDNIFTGGIGGAINPTIIQPVEPGIRTYEDKRLNDASRSIYFAETNFEEWDIKEDAGTLTKSERTLRTNIEESSTLEVASTLEKMSELGADVAADSETARFIRNVAEFKSRLKSKKAIRNIDKAVKTLTATVRDKPVLGRLLKRI